ncbi:MAG TPA: hypothetical protein VD886_02315 [Herpetosiphonaceae bacterium]|nr:hypothetical protein [Herpetosiphonaceae bacterium]
MPQISFSPAGVRRYWASAERTPDIQDMIVYGFGTSADSIITYPVSTAEEPNSFHYFQERWTVSGDGSDTTDHWAGFMVLRYLCGYRTQWEVLAEPLRRQAQRSDSTGPEDGHALVTAIQAWALGWEAQLQPLVDGLKGPA